MVKKNKNVKTSHKSGYMYIKNRIRTTLLFIPMQQQWLQQDPNGLPYIYFHSKSTDYAWMSNFHGCQHPFEIDGTIFTTVEHAFQYAKMTIFGKTDAARNVLAASTPRAAKIRGGKRFAMLSPQEITTWNKLAIDVMYISVSAKFASNPELAEKLVNTGNAVLVEKLPRFGDKRWGVTGCDCIGDNYLGVILMDIRKDLIQKIKC